MKLKKPYAIIFFKHPKVQQFLLKNGFVYTIRHHGRKVGYCKIYFNNIHIANGYIHNVAEYNYDNLKRYYIYSGFSSAEEWKKTVERIFRKRQQYLRIYKVEVIEWLI